MLKLRFSEWSAAAAVAAHRALIELYPSRNEEFDSILDDTINQVPEGPAKERGIASVQSCQSCHAGRLPKKDSFKVNEMGQWLVDQKEARKAKEIDVAWLKEYKPKAK